MAGRNKKKGSVVNIIEGIVIAVLIILIAGMLFLYFTFSENGAAPSVFGYTIYHTKAVKMEPKIPQNTVVFGKTGDLENVKVGSVVICRIGEDTVLTRVVQLVSDNGQMEYVVKFDTAPANDTFKLPAENIIARAESQSSLFGSVLSFATSTFGIMLVIIIPSFLIIVFQIIRIVNVKRVEEESYSLDELDEIMDNNEEEEHEFYEQPADFTVPAPEPVPEKTVLSVDKNGKAGLSAVREEGTPLFSYNGVPDNRDSKGEKSASAVKLTKVSHGDTHNHGISGENRSSAENIGTPAAEGANEETSTTFMSNVIRKDIAEAAAKAEIPVTAENTAESVNTYSPKPVREDKIVKTAVNIPEKAVVPKEKLAPPKKKNNSKAISELMSIIDAEESKLKK